MTARIFRLFALFAAFGLLAAAVGLNQAGAAESQVGLGTAASFAVIGGTTVTNTGPSTVGGDIGVSPGTVFTGFPPGKQSSGTIHQTDAVAAQAQADVTTAYNDAAGRTPFTTVAADLGGTTLVSGVYRGGTLGLTGTLTLDAKGDPSAVFIFQAASTLITTSASQVALTNGANACNVYWQVGSSATLGTNSTFVGTVLALTSITAQTGASIQGRLLARNADVTLDNNTITNGCANTTATTTTTTSAVTTSAVTTTAVTTTAPPAPTATPTRVLSEADAATPVAATPRFTG